MDPIADTLDIEMPEDFAAELPDLPDFDGDLDVPGNVVTGFLLDEPLTTKPRMFAEIPAHRIKSNNAEELATTIAMPPEGGYVECLVAGNFIFGDILRYLAIRMGGDCRVTLATLSYSGENVGMLISAMEEGSISQLDMIVSDYFYAHERHALYRATIETMAKQIKAGTFRLAVASSHAKAAAIANDRFQIVMTGSANLRSSGNAEVFMLVRDNESYAFHTGWMNAIIDKYEVTKGHQGHDRKGLWECIQEA